MTRILKKKAKIAEEMGIFNFVDKIHERIKVKEEEIIFYKNKEYNLFAKATNIDYIVYRIYEYIYN